jgi:TolB-like protein
MLKQIRDLMILALLFATHLLLAEEKIPIAVMELKPIEVQANTAKAVTDLIRTEIFNTGLFRVFERGEIEQVLKEQQFGQTGLSEISDAVKLGKMLQAKKVLVGTVSKLGTSYIVNARIIDVEKGEMEFADKAQADSENTLVQAVETFARKIAERIQASTGSQPSPQKTTKPVKTAVNAEKRTSSGGSLRTPSILLMGSGAVVGGTFFIWKMQTERSYDHYRSLPPKSPDFDSSWNKVTLGITLQKASLITGGVLFGTGMTMLLIGSKQSRTALIEKQGTGLRMSYSYLTDTTDISYTMRW